MINLKIIGTGNYLPETVVTNQMMTEIVDTNDEWIVLFLGAAFQNDGSPAASRPGTWPLRQPARHLKSRDLTRRRSV